MKARIKKTGEIVNLAEYARITLEQCDSWGNPVELKPEEVELIEERTECEDKRIVEAIKYILYENYTDAAVIEGVEIAQIVAWLEKQKEQEPAEWSEEDEAKLKRLCRIIHIHRLHGLLSLKEESELGKWIDKWINHEPQHEKKWRKEDAVSRLQIRL